ncbi:MAG TPA: hypothetical protein VNO70_06775, partial [Blastocatellia bacterium]|nr:hypothetical protein [Blastocatellia bacterium]
QAKRVAANASSRPQAAAAGVKRRSLPFAIASVAAGDFTGDRRVDLALVSQDGELRVLSKRTGAAGAGLAGWESEVAASGFGPGATRLARARLAGKPADDLLVTLRTG